MPKYDVPCADGTDNNCWKYVERHIPIHDLDPEQLEELARTGRTTISREQLEDASELIKGQVEPEDVDETHNDILYDIEAVCGACGSSESYSPDGENVTAL